MFQGGQEGVQNGDQLPGSTSGTGELYGRRHYRRATAADRAAFPAVRRLQRVVRRASPDHLSSERKRFDRVAGWMKQRPVQTVKEKPAKPASWLEPVGRMSRGKNRTG